VFVTLLTDVPLLIQAINSNREITLNYGQKFTYSLHIQTDKNIMPSVKRNGSWITQILAFYNSLVDTQIDENLLTQDLRSVKAFKDYLPVVFLMTVNNCNST